MRAGPYHVIDSQTAESTLFDVSSSFDKFLDTLSCKTPGIRGANTNFTAVMFSSLRLIRLETVGLVQ